MGKQLDKFLLLMWKNWILQIRHPVQTVFEILVPVLFCTFLVFLRNIVASNKKSGVSYPMFDPIQGIKSPYLTK